MPQESTARIKSQDFNDFRGLEENHDIYIVTTVTGATKTKLTIWITTK